MRDQIRAYDYAVEVAAYEGPDACDAVSILKDHLDQSLQTEHGRLVVQETKLAARCHLACGRIWARCGARGRVHVRILAEHHHGLTRCVVYERLDELQ